MNRGVRRSTLFKQSGDYEAFFHVMNEAVDKVDMRLLAFTLMPNHWHLALWPREDGDLTEYVGKASQRHACRWTRVHETRGTGPVYQGRFKAIPVETGVHLLTVLRYVERNPVRAGLVRRAEDWPWSSASDCVSTSRPAVSEWPMPRPERWLDLVNEPEPDLGLAALRECVTRSAPYGSDAWRDETVARLGWTTGVRPQGRPRGPARV
jgi:putative transposase